MLRETLGNRHPDTLTSIGNLGLLLKDQGKYDEAEPLLREDLQACRETLGDRHPSTLSSIGHLADLLRERDQLDAASAELGDAVAVATEVLGPDHLITLVTVAKAARLTLAQTGNVEPLRETVWRMEAVLGKEHPQTVKYAKAAAEAVPRSHK